MDLLAHEDAEAWEWWRKYKRDPAPTAPYDRNPKKASQQAFDRRHRNLKIPSRWLISYADALSDYHLQPENKFLGGEVRRGGGRLKRRHIVVTGVQSIGKEAEGWEEQLFIGGDDAEILYGLTPQARAAHLRSIRMARKRFSVRKFMKAAQVTDRTIAAAASGQNLVSNHVMIHLAEVASHLWFELEARTAEQAELCDWALQKMVVEGNYAFAARIGVDGSNLRKAIVSRKLSIGMLDKIRLSYNEDTTAR